MPFIIRSSKAPPFSHKGKYCPLLGDGSNSLLMKAITLLQVGGHVHSIGTKDTTKCQE